MKERKCSICQKSITFHYDGKCLACKHKNKVETIPSPKTFNLSAKHFNVYTVFILFIVVMLLITYVSNVFEKKELEKKPTINEQKQVKNPLGRVGYTLDSIEKNTGEINQTSLRSGIAMNYYELFWNEQSKVTQYTINIQGIKGREVSLKEGLLEGTLFIPQDSHLLKKETTLRGDIVYSYKSNHLKKQTGATRVSMVFKKSKTGIHTIIIQTKK